MEAVAAPAAAQALARADRDREGREAEVFGKVAALREAAREPVQEVREAAEAVDGAAAAAAGRFRLESPAAVREVVDTEVEDLVLRWAVLREVEEAATQRALEAAVPGLEAGQDQEAGPEGVVDREEVAVALDQADLAREGLEAVEEVPAAAQGAA